MVKQSVIILRVQKAEDILFQSSIPLSCKRLLNQDAEEFIVDEAKTIPDKNSILLSIRVSEQRTLKEEDATTVINKHFHYCKEKTEEQLRTIIKLGEKSLLIGFAFLIGMFLMSQLLAVVLPDGGLMLTLKEFFIIVGWVAMWRPAELLLYEWRPYKRKVRLFERLSHSTIEFIR